MEQNNVKIVLTVQGMSCTNCELRIENQLKTLTGLISAKASYTKQNVNIVYDPSKITKGEIIASLTLLDYKVESVDGQSVNSNNLKSLNWREIIKFSGIAVILFIILFVINNVVGVDISEIDPNMGYGILFIVGLVTSLHCITMCGGINLSLCMAYKPQSNVKFSKIISSILYNTGRVISYTFVGGIVGALGSVINISQGTRGVGAVISGTFMILMGLSMMGAFPALRKFIPKMPKIFGRKIYAGVGKSSPLIIGLLNGLMPCGPLQSIQLYALGTGSIFYGALSMFLFSLGTAPAMFVFGSISSLLSKQFTIKMMTISAMLVMCLGIFMFVMGFRARLM